MTRLLLVLCLILAMGRRMPARAQEAPAAYRLAYQDHLSISSNIQDSALKEQAPETPHGRSYPIGPDGVVSLPLIGPVVVGGLTVPEAVQLLQEKYRPYFGEARFVVNVVRYHPRAITVLGEVHRPGTFGFETQPTVISALAQAGGVTDWGASQRVSVLRGTRIIREMPVERLLTGQEPDLPLEEHDVVRVHAPWSKPLVQSLPMVGTLLAGLTTLIVYFVRVEP